MRKMSLFRQLYSCYLSKPASDRKLYRMATQYEIQNIVEVGITSIERTCRIIDLAHRFNDTPVQYTGIDLFEAEVKGTTRIGLKVAHVELKKTGAQVKLMPGDPFSCLSRNANLLAGTDLLIIGKNADDESLGRSWFYLPRLLHEESLVVIESETGGQVQLQESSLEEIQKKANESLEKSNGAVVRRAA